MAYKISITRQENLPVVKKVQLDEPVVDPVTKLPTGTKKTTVDYPTYEWKETGVYEYTIPEGKKSLDILTYITERFVGYNKDKKCYDSNIRYQAEFHKVEDESPQKEITYIFTCNACNCISFDTTCEVKAEGQTTVYSCPQCGTELSRAQ